MRTSKSKRIVSMIISVCLVLSSAAALPQGTLSGGAFITASAVFDSGDMRYVELEDGTLEVKEYIGYSVSATIPRAVSGKIVTSIGDGAFAGNKSVKTLFVSNTVTHIGERAFYNTEVKNISLSDKLESIGDYAFGSTNFDNITLPESLLSIGEGAFQNNKALKDIAVPGSVRAIGSNAFSMCTALEKVTINQGTESIMSGAFENCAKLSQVSLPNSLVSIGSCAFMGNSALKSVILPDGVQKIEYCAFQSCTALESVFLSENLTTLEYSAFNGCTSLKSISVPSNVTVIADTAFYNCKSLESVSLNENITSIGANAFMSCQKLKSIDLPSALTGIGSGAFYDCTSLTSITIPDKVKKIEWGTFACCKSLKNISLPESISDIGAQAFMKCEKLQSITLPSRLKSIGDSAFEGCKRLTDISIPKMVTTIGGRAFCATDGLVFFEVPDNVKKIGNQAFGFTVDENNNLKVRDDFKIICSRGSAAASYAKASGVNHTAVGRIAGSDRYATAARISYNTFPAENPQYVILAYGLNYADALAGVPLATALDAPILLTDKDSLSLDTLNEIDRLGATDVIILGGEGVISADVETQLSEYGLTTERLAGKSRYETAVLAAKRFQTVTEQAPTQVFFVYGGGFADALSISTVAALRNAPIIYLKTDGSIDADTKAYLSSLKGTVTKAYVIGGTGVISDDMMDAAGRLIGVTPKRIAGANRYETCISVAQAFSASFSSNRICVATGLNFPDALAGGVFAAKQKAPMILADKSLTSAHKSYLSKKNVETVIALGGIGAVPDTLVSEIIEVSK